MSKIIPLLIGGTGVAAASCGGVLLLRRGNAEVAATPTTTSTQDTTPEDLLFDTVDKFKNEGKTHDCVRSHFGENLDFGNASAKTFSENNKPGPEEFFKSNTETSIKNAGCLIINWKKSTGGTEGKWTGKFTWLWTFVRGEEGFVSFNVAEPTSEEGKLKFTGVFYLVGKEGQTGSVKFKKEIQESDNKTPTKEQVDEFFPKTGSTLKTSDSSLGDYWGFAYSNESMKKICSGDGCPADPKTVSTKKFTGTVASEGQENAPALKDWTATSDGWDKIYGLNSQGNFTSKIQTFKGTGTKQADS